MFEHELRSCFGIDVSVIECVIERIKYRPHRNCLMGYKLKLRDRMGTRKQRLCVGIYTAEAARDRYEKAMARDWVASNFPAVMHLPNLNMVVWAFPNERKLPALPLFADRAQLRECMLRDVVQARWGAQWEIIDFSHNISNYFPEHSCCINVALTLREVESRVHKTWNVIGKMRHDDAGVQTHAHMLALWRSGDCDVSYARPLIYHGQFQVQWQERLPGVPLHSLLVSGRLTNLIVKRVAKAVAALHRSAIPTMRRFSVSDLIEELRSAQTTIANAWPNCVAALDRAVDTLIVRGGKLDGERNGICHGDLHSNNILVGTNQVYLLDLDDVSSGPLLADLGSFLAELIYRGCVKTQRLSAVQPLLNSVVVAYRQAVPWSIADDEIAWYTASALIRERALRCVNSLKPVRGEVLDRVIVAAAAILQAGIADQELAGNRSDAMERAA